jgi:hypothetical protein
MSKSSQEKIPAFRFAEPPRRKTIRVGRAALSRPGVDAGAE